MRLISFLLVLLYFSDGLALDCKIINTVKDPSILKCELGGKPVLVYLKKDDLLKLFQNHKGPGPDIQIDDSVGMYLDESLKNIINGCVYIGESQILKFPDSKVSACATPTRCISNGLSQDRVVVCSTKTLACPGPRECINDKSLSIEEYKDPAKKKLPKKEDNEGEGAKR